MVLPRIPHEFRMQDVDFFPVSKRCQLPRGKSVIVGSDAHGQDSRSVLTVVPDTRAVILACFVSGFIFSAVGTRRGLVYFDFIHVTLICLPCKLCRWLLSIAPIRGDSCNSHTPAVPGNSPKRTPKSRILFRHHKST